MDFSEFKEWLKARSLSFRLEGWSGCIVDTILVLKGDDVIFTGPYDRWVDYSEYVRRIEAGDPGGEM